MSVMFADLSGDHRWVFDLVADADSVRAKALARHVELKSESSRAMDWYNQLWHESQPFAEVPPAYQAEMDQALAAMAWFNDQTVFGPVGRFLKYVPVDPLMHLLYTPFGLLYLRWEARYPAQWSAPDGTTWSHQWGCKELVLGRFAGGGVPPEYREQMAELILAAVQRPYRCKDWMYALSVRHVWDARFASAIDRLSQADDLLVALRAQFLRHVAVNDELRIKRVTWHRWLASQGRPSLRGS